MNAPPNASPLVLLLTGALVGSVAVWTRIARRAAAGRAPIDYRPRLKVPWQAPDVAMALAIFLLLPWGFILAAEQLAPSAKEANRPIQAGAEKGENPPSAAATDPQGDARSAAEADQRAAHPLVQLLQSRRGAGTIVLAILAAVVVAPLAEEMTFRVILQGWMERVMLGLSPRSAWRRRLPPILSAIPFALLHARSADAAPPSPEDLARSLWAYAAGGTAVVLSIVALMRIRGARWPDLGLPRDLGWPDFRVGLAALLALTPVVYAIQVALYQLAARWSIAADPVPLVVLAVGLGYVYRQTHCLLASLVMHAGFNAFSLALYFAWPQMGM